MNHIDAVLDQQMDRLDAGRAVPVLMKRRRGMRVASLRAEMKIYAEAEVLHLERELLRAFSRISRRSPGSSVAARWLWLVNCRAFTEIRIDPPRRTFYDLKDLPPIMAACPFSSNDDVSAEEAYRAMNAWMSTRHFSLAGPKREIYLDNMLEIQFPLNCD